jgi:putative tryptophan/tyrosine transport system substrate-binding protein
MKRRELLGLLGGAVVAWTLAARAQEPGRTYRLGSLHFSPRSALHHVALFAELKRQGFIAGQNLWVDERGYGLHLDQFAEHAAELVKAQVDAIYCGGDPNVRAAQQATQTIPIVAVSEDLVRSGFIRSLAKPGGNTTGVSILSPELDGKRQEILTEAVPGIHRMAALSDSNSDSPEQLQALQTAARARGLELSIYSVTKPDEIAGAVDAAQKSGAEALNVLASSLLYNNRQIVRARISALRLPAIYQFPEMSEEGGLIGYGPRLVQVYGETVARQIVALFRGAKPIDVPVEQPSKFELVINLNTAKTLGMTIPTTMLDRADRVIE